MKILLDTCAFIWLTSDPANLGDRAVAAINDQRNELFLSDVTVWEITLKWQVGKIGLPAPPRMWMEEQARLWRLKPLAIERSHMYRVSELPEHHRDPFDRLLVAQAIEHGFQIATPDRHIAAYPVAVVWS